MQPLSKNDHRNPLETLRLLHFTYNEWNWENSPQPQFRNFCHWMKQSILRKHPVIFGIFLPGNDYEDYDHIVPAVGIRYINEKEYDQDDVLIYYDLYKKEEIKKKMNEDEFGATRETINRKDEDDDEDEDEEDQDEEDEDEDEDDDDDDHDDCLPLDVRYSFLSKQNKFLINVLD